jgi:hypothetical protein
MLESRSAGNPREPWKLMRDELLSFVPIHSRLEDRGRSCTAKTCGHSSNRQDGHHHISFFELDKNMGKYEQSILTRLTNLDKSCMQLLLDLSWMVDECFSQER